MRHVTGTKKIILAMEKKEKERKKASLIYVVPFVAVLLTLLLFVLPIIRFTNFQNELTESTSVFKSIFNNIGLARKVLFSAIYENDEVYTAFAKFVLVSALVSLLLFVTGFICALAYMLTGLSFVKNPNEKIKQRRLFLTFIPNKATFFVLSILCIAPSIFPKLLSLLIERMLVVYTKTDVAVVAVAFALWLLSLVATLIIEKKTDKSFNVFAQNIGGDDVSDKNDGMTDEERSNQVKDLAQMLEKSKRK